MPSPDDDKKPEKPSTQMLRPQLFVDREIFQTHTIRVEIRIPSSKELHNLLRPYAYHIGTLAFEYNKLQEALANLFGIVSTIKNGVISRSIWYSTPNDRAQREMLRAVLDVTFGGRQKQKDDLAWLLNKANTVVDQRNDAIHAPFVVFGRKPKPVLGPDTFSGNPRARKLKGKDAIKEFRWYRDCAKTLRKFAERAELSLRWPDKHSWPDRPRLPHLGQSPIRTPPYRRKRAK